MLKRQGVIETWHDRRIGAGQNIDSSIDKHINSDQIILLLVSSDFLNSSYCYDIEMLRALQRHEAGDAIVIPVILRACEWQHAPFGKLAAVPRDGKPLAQWPDIDEALLQVAKAIREAATRNAKTDTRAPATTNTIPPELRTALPSNSGPRSSNLRVAKSFSQMDKDNFKSETFEFIAKYFQNSMDELSRRHKAITGVFRRVDANRFFATLYNDGRDVARATIFMGSTGFGSGINFAQGETMGSNSLNDSLSVHADDQMLYLTSMGMFAANDAGNKRLSQEGAAELFWSAFIVRIQ